jgi:hypothetical protein
MNQHRGVIVPAGGPTTRTEEAIRRPWRTPRDNAAHAEPK